MKSIRESNIDYNQGSHDSTPSLLIDHSRMPMLESGK